MFYGIFGWEGNGESFKLLIAHERRFDGWYILMPLIMFALQIFLGFLFFLLPTAEVPVRPPITQTYHRSRRGNGTKVGNVGTVWDRASVEEGHM